MSLSTFNLISCCIRSIVRPAILLKNRVIFAAPKIGRSKKAEETQEEEQFFLDYFPSRLLKVPPTDPKDSQETHAEKGHTR